jgi:GT2 family glycosyltransferase
MRVLADIIAFNDADVIEQVLDGLRRQTRSADAILIVDNASTDATLERTFPEDVTIVRNSENQGPSGAVGTGFAHALGHGFDWVWVLDADGVPEPDALENLLAFYEGLPVATRKQLCFLNGWPLTATGGIKEQPISLERAALQPIPLASARDFTQCDCMIWCGSLFRMAAAKQIGLPSPDYVADMGEIEYGYRARQLGFTSYIVHNSVIHHDVGRNPGVVVTKVLGIGRWKVALRDLSPWRAYYASRNPLYFWLYQCRPRQPRPVFRAIVQASLSPLGFVLRPVSHRRQLIASLRGLWDGLTAHMERRY